MHPEIGEIAAGLVERKKYVYLCTNAILLEQRLDEGIFTPSDYFSFSVHLDGVEEDHDEAVCRDGVYDQAVAGVRAALDRGFRVTTNTTLFDNANPLRVRDFFDEMTALGVDGMMLSPGYSYSKAPDQEHFLRRGADPQPLPRHSQRPQARVALQPVAALPAVPHGQAGLRVHAVGESALQRLRLAAPLLSAPGRLCAHVPRPHGRYGLGRVRAGQRQTPSAATAWCIPATSRRRSTPCSRRRE